MTIEKAFEIIEKEFNLTLPYQFGRHVRFMYKGAPSTITCCDEIEAQKILAQIKSGFIQKSLFEEAADEIHNTKE